MAPAMIPLRKIVLGVALSLGASICLGDELPSLAGVVRGDVAVSAAGNTLSVNQSSDQAIIDWNTFDVGAGAAVRFNQPTAQSLTINNILSTQPAVIDGALSANGRLFFSSPNGMIFGKDSKVNVDTLLATTHGITAKSINTFELNNAGAGQIINLGQLSAKNVYLIGRDVRNSGIIESPRGAIGLLAASDLRVTFDDSGLLSATILSDDLLGEVENTGTMSAGKIQLKASASEAAVASTIKNNVTKADTLISENGVFKLVRNTGTLRAKTVELDAGNTGGVQAGGRISVDNPIGKGGLVTITGKEVTLTSGAQISANGSSGGGEILIGGDWQGTGPLLQSTFATVEAGAEIGANATDEGNGGKIVIWSDISNPNSVTKVGGTLSATGGPNGGDGGQIETSGKVLDIANIELTTIGENIGLWLLDPTNVTIDNAYATNLSNALNTTNVTVQADNDIYFGFNNGITKSSGVETTLTLDAGNNIISNSANLHTINGAVGSPLSVTLNAGNLVQLRWIKIDTKGGDVSFNANQIQSDAAGGAQWAVFADNIQVNSDVFAINATNMNGTSANATSGLFSATSDMNFTIGNHLTLMYTAALKAQGNISINGTSPLVQLRNGSSIETVNGNLEINAAILKQRNYLPSGTGSVGGVLNNYLKSGSGNLTLNVDSYIDDPESTGKINGKILVSGTGGLTAASFSSSFLSDFSWNTFYNSNPILGFAGAAHSSLTIGKNSNTARVSIDAPISTAGAVTVTGGTIDGNANITTSAAATGSITIKAGTYSYGGNLSVGAGSTISLNYGSSNQTVDFSKFSGMGTLVLSGSGLITQSSAVTVDKLALKGAGSYTLSNTANRVNTLAAGNDDGSGIGALTFVNAGALTIGSVNPRGLKTNNGLSVTTQSGDLMIADNIEGDTVTLNAGATARSGNASSGNIVVSGTPSIKANSGNLRLYTGDYQSSLNLLRFIDTIDNTIENADETAAINLQGKYIVMREEPQSSIKDAVKEVEAMVSASTAAIQVTNTETSMPVSGGRSNTNLVAGKLSLGSESRRVDVEGAQSGEDTAQDDKSSNSEEEEEVAELNNGEQEAGAGGSDENDNAISGELGNQGNDKDVGNAGGARGNKPAADDTSNEDAPVEETQPVELALLSDDVANNGEQEAGAGGSDENDNAISGELGNQGNDKDVGNAGGARGNNPPAEDPPAEDPPAEDPPAEDPPVEEDIQVITPVIVLNEDNFEGGDERNIIARELEAVELYSDTFIYQVSDDVFKHTDPAAEITVSVEMADGSPLPTWLQYDVQEKRIIGNRPTSGPIVLEIKLIGRDQFGDSAETVVRIKQGVGR